MMKGLILLILIGTSVSQQVEVWMSSGDSTKQLVEEPAIIGSSTPVGGDTINVDQSTKYQSMVGFGAALTNAASSLIYNHPDRTGVLESLFNPNTGIGLSFVRLVMGGSDFNAVNPYTYNDGAEDLPQDNFSIDDDRAFVLPLVQEIKANYPDVSIMATPWSPPAWMKNPEALEGGSMKNDDQYFESLAEYLVKFVQAYAAEGINIDFLSVQNEPEHGTSGYPSMLMSSTEQARLIRDHLGPKFAAAGITTQILILDHNWDLTSYVEDILNDPAAAAYVAGSAWHCYAGAASDPSTIKNQFPSKDLHFTECSGGEWDTHFGSVLGWNIQNLFIGQSRIGSRSVLMWNLALDENFGPRVGVTGGCADCRGVLTLASNNQVTQNPEYAILGHFAKFVRPGASMIWSDTYPAQELETVAYENPDGSIVVEILNVGWDATTQTFQVVIDGMYYYYENLPSRSHLTFIRR